MPKLLQYLFYPIILVFALIGSIFLLSILHVDQFVFIPGIIVLPLIVIFIIFERKYPYKKGWNKSKGDFETDLLQSFIILPLAGKLSEILLPFLLYFPLVWMADFFDGNIFGDMGILGVTLISLLVCEFCYYWMHRISHTNKHLWRLHSIHHGAERVYWANSGRFHFIDAFLGSAAYFLPLILLGTSQEVIVLILTISAITGFMEHINIDFNMGSLNYVFNTAQLHRWHHSIIEKESNTNYGKVLIIWDLIFGTFLFPKNKNVGRVGIKGKTIPVRFMQQFTYPFRRYK